MTSPTYGQQPAAPEPEPRRGVPARLIAAGALLVISLIFIVENTRSVRMRILIPQVTAPLWLALAIAFLLGGVLGFFLSRRRLRKA